VILTKSPVLPALLLLIGCSSVDVVGSRGDTIPAKLPNILEKRINTPLSTVNEQVNAAFMQLFFGDPGTEAVYRDQGDGSAYIEDIYHGDVRTDSMGYGMMVAVQLGEQEVFDKLWTWTKENMQNKSGPTADLLNWNCKKTGDDCISASSTDAMSIITTALFLADSRFLELEHDYEDDANALLDAMVKIEERNEGIVDGVVNSFDLEEALPRAGSSTPHAAVPVDYLMPAFYEIWAERRPEERDFWHRAAANSRDLLSRVSAPETGLYPGTVYYTGTPVPGALDYTSTTSRAHLNIALDHLRNGPHEWVAQHNEVLLDFFLTQGMDAYVVEYSLSGEPLVTFNTAAHRSMVALAAGTTLKQRHDAFLQALVDQSTPSGTFRYYDGMMHLLSLLVLSGQFTLN
jgi:oligosaccharide reducing-end xylanase